VEVLDTDGAVAVVEAIGKVTRRAIVGIVQKVTRNIAAATRNSVVTRNVVADVGIERADISVDLGKHCINNNQQDESQQQSTR
jgi:hypothetical protein